MAAGYRALLQLDDSQDAIRVANEQFRSWVAELVRDDRNSIGSADWAGPGTHHIGPAAALKVVHHEGEDGTFRQLLELEDVNANGTWTTRLFAASAPHEKRLKQVLWFESEATYPDGSPVNPGTPRLVGRVLGAVDAFDSTVPVLGEPEEIDNDGADRLLGYITDDRRDISVVVVAPIPGVPAATWRMAISRLMRDCRGCASFFMLTPQAFAAVNSKLGPAYAVPAGSVRTFAPRIDLDDATDSRRHKFLTTRTMSEGLTIGRAGQARFSERLIRMLAITPRRHLLEAPLPAVVTRSARILERQHLAQAREVAPESVDIETAVAHAPSVIVEQAAGTAQAPAWLGALRNFASKLIGSDTLDDRAIEEIAKKFAQAEEAAAISVAQVDRLQGEREFLEDQVHDLRKQLEFEQFERALAEEDRRESEKKVRSLQHWRDSRPDRYEYVEDSSADWETFPTSVSELVERLTDPAFEEVTRYVELTDVEKAIDNADLVDEVDPNGTYASAFWEYVLVLRDYVIECESHGFSGNLHMYLNSNSVRGRKCPAQRHKPNESEFVQTNAKTRAERTFPIPTKAVPAGEVFMATHFAPTHRDQNAPRMYYYADPTNTKKAYIGYVGVHLTNTKTN